jgi:hypothetical protein
MLPVYLLNSKKIGNLFIYILIKPFKIIANSRKKQEQLALIIGY